MKWIKFWISDDEIYGITILGKFFDFRQWYYLYDNDKRFDSWLDTEELKYAIIGNSQDKNGKTRHNLWFKPVSKIITIFKRK